ncbi:hypothetical protein ACLMAJ_20620 [Nocardia sp. KC 131]|uniref:hypothetical protein n=1 Tax=Nocardia arseniciresistens TaxID=3392119 RepID=UPI00398F3E36
MSVSHTDNAAEPPGPVVLAMALIGVAALLFVRIDHIPFVGGLTGPDQLIGLLVGTVLLGPGLVVWAIKTLYLVGREGRWSWKVTAVPAVAVTGIVLGLVLRPADFESARPAMEKAALEMLRANGPSTRADLSLGGLDISFADRRTDDRVYFYDADGAIGSNITGWVYSPSIEPAQTFNRRFEKLSDNWYAFVFTTE